MPIIFIESSFTVFLKSAAIESNELISILNEVSPKPYTLKKLKISFVESILVMSNKSGITLLPAEQPENIQPMAIAIMKKYFLIKIFM